ncbi:MAG: ABC transporter permease, partial [Chloroflexota bacterium]|nr:ABC transporter permease [Chloroflexota bacterium]
MTASDTAFGRPARASAAREFGSSVVTIMVKELRSRMRGRRAFIVLTVYLAILALITYGVYVIVAPNARGITGGGFGGGGFGGQANASALIGQSIFTLLSIFQLILICFIAPAFTAGQISLEREKQTLDLLISTPMRPSAIVIGKLAAALAFVVLMIVAAIPITAIVLM